MEDHLHEHDDAEGGLILRFPRAGVEDTFRAYGGLDETPRPLLNAQLREGRGPPRSRPWTLQH
jgi:hypothetical protein